MSDGGKGSSPRPKSVSNEEYANRWDAIFQRDKRVEEDQQNEDEEFEAILKRNRESALDDLVKINQELGLYDEPEDKITRYNEETQEVKLHTGSKD
jgi:hypothetical protein